MPLKPGLIAGPQQPSLSGPPKAKARPFRWLYAALLALTLGYLSIHEYRAHQCARRQLTRASRTRVPSGSRNPAYLIEASHGAVASENEVCSRMGVDTMKAGGNAVDAAVTTTLCIGVANMFS